MAEVKQAGVKVYQSWGELENPVLDHSGKHQSAHTFSNQFPDRLWWESFHDPQLTVYIQAAIQNSPSIQIALHQLESSRALVRQAVAKELPSVNLSPSVYRLGLPSNLTQQLPLSRNQFLYNLPLQLSYEVDWFGKNWDGVQSAKKRTEAVELQSKAAVTAVLGEVSGAYINLLRTDALLDHQQQQVTLLKQIATLETSRYEAGLTDQKTVLDAERDALAAENTVKRLQSQQALWSHQLAIFTGSPPAMARQLERRTLTQMELPSETPAGMPAVLLSRRPDILAQEALLESARIDVKVARKAFLPTLNIGSLVGTAGLQFSKLWDWSNVFNVQNLLLNQPVFRGGQLSAELNYKKAKQKEALENYRLAVLTGLKEVEDSLSALKSLQSQQDATQRQMTVTEQKWLLNQSLLRQGLIARLDVLRTQSELNRYQQALLAQKADAAIATISLYKALGGGF
ncbi:efflux transporter outer membrane subunit [Vampirovibrio chlorellavorus]|uniref:efflux transporter outer membrane subunit n=1 Tax=Vampirovibrio chlorellavorus TaxID=758823 RepID=UPI0026EEF05B|nr:efflux transporter outer membrane subunit [Vampirovibrio chlorellavorus]